jgi:exodeoxyribonuclease VII small subunit
MQIMWFVYNRRFSRVWAVMIDEVHVMTKQARPNRAVVEDASANVDEHLLPTNYEAALHELEQIVQAMQNDSLALDDLLSAYQRSAVLLQFCKDKLKSVEQQIKVIEQDKSVDLSDS